MDSDQAGSIACAACGTAVTREDFLEGLAVKVDGRPLCPQCIDALPGTTQVKINQVRAIRGLDVTTYRLPCPEHPDLGRYTFTTTAQLNGHRRQLAITGHFAAPLVPPDLKPVPKLAVMRPAPVSRRHGPALVIASLVAGIVLVGVAIGLLVPRHTPVAVTDPGTQAPATRGDYPPAADAAWAAIRADPACPTTVRDAVVIELRNDLDHQLAAAETALAADDRARVRTLLAALVIPDDLFFRSEERRRDALQKALNAPAKPPVVAPAPVAVATVPSKPAPAVVPVVAPPVVAPPVVTAPTNVPEPVKPAEPAEEPEPAGRVKATISELLPRLRAGTKPLTVDEIDVRTKGEAMPGNLGPAALSESTSRTRQLVRYDGLVAGGVAVLLHPLRSDRVAIEVAFVGNDGRTSVVKVTFGDKAAKPNWATVVVPAPVEAVPPFSAVIVQDADDLSTPFLVAKVVAVAGRAPETGDLGLRPPAISAWDLSDFATIITLTSRARKLATPVWIRQLAPEKVLILGGDRLLSGNWDTKVRAALKTLLNADLPNGTIQTIVLQDQWLNELITPPANHPAVLDPEKHHFLVIGTAAVEFPIGLSGEQAQRNFWIPLLKKVIARGVIPVVLLGPSKVDAAQQDDAEALWTALSAQIRQEAPGIPVIDLRPAKAVSHERMARGAAQLSIDLFLDGYATIARRIQMLQATKAKPR